jgi:transposase
MPVLPGSDRSQIQFFSLETAIEPDNEARAIDALANVVPMEELGFEVKGQSHEGRPVFPAKALFKLLIYGYRNGIRSSRKLEKACQCNVELWYLLNYQQPCYKTIANFRKDNPKALRRAFRHFNQLFLEWGLFGGELAAIDGSKFRAQNSKKNNYNAAKIQRHLDYIDDKLDAYFSELDEVDGQACTDDYFEQANDKIEDLMGRRFGYEQLAKELDESGGRQLSTTDPDARALPLHMGIVEVGYNVQTAVDDKHCMVAHYEVENEKDDVLLAKIATGTKQALDVQTLDVLADKGYHAGAELKACADEQVVTFVSPKQPNSPKKAEAYQKQQFEYDAQKDEYICPQGKALRSNGKEYQKNSGQHRRSYKVKHYIAPYATCKQCPAKSECLSQSMEKWRRGRAIERSEYEAYVEANAERVKANKEKYRRRQATVEHPFGTIKRSWGYTYTLMKGKLKVAGEFALIFSSYNLRRVMSILGVKGIIQRLEGLKNCLLAAWCMVRAVESCKMIPVREAPRWAMAA